ncbi:NAD(P)-binding protein [Daedalea quercina L-15889]|uniref:NAD(P)-binding protein n=1 Tax=Daedalea quercina L-15889 TaxID=1314783 RepID=A0A165LQM5_9APHY|nr:NAD(P)-binding protein [Daedalea quercina L-15889]
MSATSEKVWLITGANSGIGCALAQYALSQGDKVIATVRALSKFPESLKKAGGQSLMLDLSAPDADIRNAGTEALRIYGRVDVLVNNAGWGAVAPVEELDMGELRASFQAMVFGAIVLTQSLLPHFRERKTGHVLNVSSIAGFIGVPSWGAYCGAKAALELLSESLSAEVAPFHIRVLIVMPGYFSTKFFEHASSVDKNKQATVYTGPSQGFGTIEGIPRRHVEAGQIGDVEKLAARVFEVVHGVGLAKGLVEGQGGKREWLRIPLGPDCGERIIKKIQVLKENAEAFEPIWRSTDVEPERLKFFARG